MVKDPRLGCKVVATVTGAKGKCNVDHRVVRVQDKHS